MLCSNRPEGFGPRSHLYPHILTSCFLDTILVPLCTWLYLIALVVLVCLARSSKARRTNQSSKSAYEATEDGDTTINMSSNGSRMSRILLRPRKRTSPDQKPKRHHGLRLVLSVLYYLLLVAQILMCTLELVRLALAHLGIGLLPFTYVAIICALIVHWSSGLNGRVVGWPWLNMALFLALAITNSVKVAEEVREGPASRKGTKYPESDEIIDVSVMIGVYIAEFVLEPILWLL